jgi:ribosomal-protein-alanine N-acetyltransferase
MIRKAGEKDLPVLAEMEAELFPSHPWKESDFAYEIRENPFSEIFLEEKDETAEGYVVLWIMYEQAQIANIGVRRAFQHEGIASQLMHACINRAIEAGCENLSLEVRVSNAKAIGLYEKFGFLNINTRKKYYEDGEDAYLMVKPLGGLSHDDVISA